MTPDFTHFRAAAHERRPGLALILGSGLSNLTERLERVEALPFAQVPGLETPTVPGHRGMVLLGDWAGRPVLVFAGRLHAYEGHAWPRVAQPVRLAHELGVRTLLITNAAGGIRADLNPGDLLAIRAHLDWTRPDRWHHPPQPGPYAPALSERLQHAAAQLGSDLATGVYAQVTGPSYETPAEIRALRTCGADAVGMSTAREAQTAVELGLACVAVSCITNKAAGLSTGPINHEEVLATAALQRERLARLIEAFLHIG